MLSEKSIRFLQEKITDIKTAILHNLSEALIKLPTSIVSTLKMDDDGHLWFLVNRPSYENLVYDNRFPVRLDFYRKGYPFYLHVSGNAHIVDGAEKMQSLLALDDSTQQVAQQNLMLLEVAIQKAEYYETAVSRKEHRHGRLFSLIGDWFQDLFHPPKNYLIMPEIYP